MGAPVWDVTGDRGGPVACLAAMSSFRVGLGLSITVPLAVALACNPGPTATPPKAPDTDVAPAPEPGTLSAEVLSVMDEAADPCQDFYRFACGEWLDETDIPSDQSRYGRFNALRDQNQATLHEILEAALADANPDPEVARLAAFYGACMDEQTVETHGTAGITPQLELVAGIGNKKQLMGALGQLHLEGVDALLDFGVSSDYDQPDINIAHFSQGGLGLPDRDYYLRDGDEAAALRTAYAEHVATMLSLLGNPDAKAAAERIIAFETELANASTPRDQLRDPKKRHNEVDAKGLAKMMPALPWGQFWKAMAIEPPKVINVSPESFMVSLSELVETTPLSTIKEYLTWNVVRTNARSLPADFVQAHFSFYDQRLRGQAELGPRWKRCVDATDHALGESLGRHFVEQRFAGDSKDIAETMIRAIEDAFAAGLPSLPWMDEATQKRALEKMHAIVNKIGYPEQWKDYGSLTLGDDHAANVITARRFELQRRLDMLGKPVDKKEWHMTPPTVNAYYNPSNNEMVFPAGILQQPFFDADYPMAMNFGGIGMVMGHELTHGFDDQGRKYDGSGRLTEWWDQKAVERFEERAQCVSDLYDEYEVQPGVTLNGKLTLGENIADFGGIKDAYRAWRGWAEQNGEGDPAVDGLTNDQLFFVAYGQIWCTKATPEAERVLALTDPHSNARYRVNGPLSNLPEFWETFSCEPGAAMRPAQTCEVW